MPWTPTAASTPVHARFSSEDDAWIPTLSVIPLDPPRSPVPATFTEFLATLEFWEAELFSDLTMMVDCYKFIRMVDTQRQRNTNINLLTMSGGSDESGAMRFGWIMSLPDGT
jgi:hypothetical protein